MRLFMMKWLLGKISLFFSFDHFQQFPFFRPLWNLAGEVIDGGAERWQNISTSKTSQEKLVVLLNEFTGGNDDDGTGNQTHINLIPDQLSPRGEGENIPFHLRSSRSVKNRRLTRRDVAVLIQEIWTERRLSDKQVYFISFNYIEVLFCLI